MFPFTALRSAILNVSTRFAVQGPLATYFSEFSLSGKPLVYNTREGYSNYFYSIPLNLMDKDVERTVCFTLRNEKYSVCIDGTEITNGCDCLFPYTKSERTFVVTIQSGDKIVSAVTLTLTGLPIVQIQYQEINRVSYSAGSIIVNDPGKANDTETIDSEFRIRGASAASEEKKSFSIKLKDSLGKKLNKSFFGLREDNNWILDAMAIDPSRMRNRVATDLWNDFSILPVHANKEKGVINGTRGQYVELFINDVYNGLYCMTEKVDRKQLKLKEYDESTSTIHGVLFKSLKWTYSTYMGHLISGEVFTGAVPPVYNNNLESWDGYEVKYPDYDECERIDWRPLNDAVTFNATTANDSACFSDGYNRYFDIPVWIDYYLFIDLLLATDNHGKNMYLYTYDKNSSSVLGVTPWDLDGVFGRRWDASVSWGTEGASCRAEQNFDAFLIETLDGQHGFIRNMKKYNPDNFNQRLHERYAELRESFFSFESLKQRFNNYKEIFDKSGAGAREKTLWNGKRVLINFDDELDYLSSWINTRLDYMDTNEYNLSNPDVDSPQTKDLFLNIYPIPVSNLLTVSNLSPGMNIEIFDCFGRLIFNEKSEDSMIQIDMSKQTPGFYCIKAGALMYKVIKK